MAKKNTSSKPASRAEHWKLETDPHDFPAAADYLELLFDARRSSQIVDALRAASIVHKKAKDLLRASRLELLPSDNVHVAIDLAKVKQGIKLSPILLVRGDARRDVALTVADGYHRICASYHLDENADIPCLIA